jgi:hypothetical protein
MNNKGECITCDDGYQFIQESQQCERIVSFDKCLPNETTISGNCYPQCPTGYFMDKDTGNCIQECASDYTFNYITKQCEKINTFNICASNETEINNKCYSNCLTPAVMNKKGECITCDDSYAFNQTSQQCERIVSFDKCLPDETELNNICYPTCPSGYFMDKDTGKCIQDCASDYTFNYTTKQCEKTNPFDKCNSNQTLIDNNCYDNCPDGYFMDMDNGKCLQNCDLYNSTTKKCEIFKPYDKCLDNQTLINNNCYDNCIDDYIMDKDTGECVKCITDYSYNQTSKLCERVVPFDKCTNGQTLINNNCYDNCKEGYFMDVSGNCIENCKTGYTYNNISKKCEQINPYDKCLDNQTTINSKCYNNCSDGFFMDMDTGDCIQNCSTGYTYNKSSKLCEILSAPNKCKPNQTLVNNKCYEICPSTHFMDMDTGDCIENCKDTYTYDKNQKICL